jgi:hypothetical protein
MVAYYAIIVKCNYPALGSYIDIFILIFVSR